MKRLKISRVETCDINMEEDFLMSDVIFNYRIMNGEIDI